LHVFRGDDGAIAEDFSFSEIEVTWSDGTKETVDIGDITITALDEDIHDTHLELDDIKDPGPNEGVSIDIDTEITITVEAFPYEQQLMEFYDEITVNDRNLVDVLDGQSMVLNAGDALTVETAVNEASESEYEQVNVLLVFRTVPKRYPDEKSYIMIRLHAGQGLEEL